MKRKLFTALVIVGAMAFTACSEDAAMEELIQDTELNANIDNGSGSGGSGSQGSGDNPPTGGN